MQELGTELRSSAKAVHAHFSVLVIMFLYYKAILTQSFFFFSAESSTDTSVLVCSCSTQKKSKFHDLDFFEHCSCGSGGFTYAEFVEWGQVLMSELHSPVLGPCSRYPVFYGYKIAQTCIFSEEGQGLVCLFHRLAIQKLCRHKYSNKVSPCHHRVLKLLCSAHDNGFVIQLLVIVMSPGIYLPQMWVLM